MLINATPTMPIIKDIVANIVEALKHQMWTTTQTKWTQIMVLTRDPKNDSKHINIYFIFLHNKIEP